MMDEDRPAISDRDDQAAPEGLSPVTGGGQARRIRRRRWLLRGLGLAGPAAILVAVLGARDLACQSQEVDCIGASPDTPAPVLIAVCSEEYERTGDPRVGIQLVRALYRSGQYEEARRLAMSLLATPVQADAHFLLGKIARREGDLTEAMVQLERARELHQAAGRCAAVAEDEHAIADVHQEARRFAPALRMADRCIGTARSCGDRRIEGYCHLTAARTLMEIGLFDGVGLELDRALRLLESERDKATLHFELGNLDQERRHDNLATVAFRRALPAAERAGIAGTVLSLHLNLAYSLAETGDLAEAARHLEIARGLDDNDKYLTQRRHLEGRVAYHGGSLSRATALLEEAGRLALAGKNNLDERILIDSQLARIGLDSGDLAAAERWARRGVENAEALLRTQTAIELRAWVLASRREPYELLFTALARAGRAEDALLVFDRWYGRTLLEGLSRSPLETGPQDLETAAFHTEELSAVLPTLTSARFLADEPGVDVLAAARSADLLALVLADGVLWRVTGSGGRFEVASIGRWRELEPLFQDFAARPTDRALADRMGALVLPAALVRATGDALRVVVDGPLSFLPVAALRSGGRPIIAIRPVVRPPRLSAVRCAPSLPPVGRAVVLADPAGNLPSARREALDIAARFGAEAHLGRSASSDALWALTSADLLHIAAHADVGAAGGVLQLHDRPVSALDILRHKVAVKRVFLATCGSARGGGSGATSLTTAFLAGGAVQVIATLRVVSDEGAEQVTGGFYRADGTRDPVRVLARVQAELADTDNDDWPNFAVYGQDICR